MYWDVVLKEVAYKRSMDYPFVFTHIADKFQQDIECSGRIMEQAHGDQAAKVRLPVLDRVSEESIYFTRRETECLMLLLAGKTMRLAGQVLGLSVRTVEFYVKNIKVKLQCRTKSEVLYHLGCSDFLDKVRALPCGVLCPSVQMLELLADKKE